MKFEKLTPEHTEQIVSLASELNPDISIGDIRTRLVEMFDYSSFICFGYFVGADLAGMANGWLTTRFYSGKQLEIDNVIVSEKFRSKGYGKEFISCIEAWALKENCLTVELNTYVANSKSHKFYFNQGYHVLGFHFQKMIDS